jgi:hypothetical protein
VTRKVVGVLWQFFRAPFQSLRSEHFSSLRVAVRQSQTLVEFPRHEDSARLIMEAGLAPFLSERRPFTAGGGSLARLAVRYPTNPTPITFIDLT